MLLQILRRVYGEHCVEEGVVMVCGTTGVSALNVEGKTVHSTTGVGHGNGSGRNLWEAKSVTRQKKETAIISKGRVLVVDEWYMMSGRMASV